MSSICSKFKDIVLQLDVGFPLAATIVAGIGSILSYLKENKSLCTPDCKLWVAGAACRYFLSFVICLFIELVRHHVISFSSDLECIVKLAEVVDVCGILWFTIGNLLIFTSSQDCASNQPICFSFAVILVSSVYLVFFFPVILKAIIKSYHEPGEASRDDQVEDRGRAVELVAATEALSDLSISHWIRWLEARGSSPFDYSSQLDASAETVHKRAEGPYQDISENDTWGSTRAVPSNNESPDCDIEVAIFVPKLVSNKRLLQCPICLDTLVPASTSERSYSAVARDEEAALADTTPATAPPITTSSAHAASSASGPQADLEKCVAFPCGSRHLFHCRCLIEWLHSSTARHAQRTANRGASAADVPVYTCPCCREQEPGELSCLP